MSRPPLFKWRNQNVPETVAQLPKRKRRVLKPPKYEVLVQQVLDGQCWKVGPNEVQGSGRHFIRMVRLEAKRRGLRVRVQQIAGTRYIQTNAGSTDTAAVGPVAGPAHTEVCRVLETK